MNKVRQIEAKIETTEADLAQAKRGGNEALILMYGYNLSELRKEKNNIESGVSEYGTGLRGIINGYRPKKKYAILFDVFSNQGNVSIRVAKKIRRIFSRNIFRQYGGYIERLSTTMGEVPKYRVLIVTSSLMSGIEDDADLDPLWKLLTGVYEIDPKNIEHHPFEGSDLDPKLANKFIIRFSAGNDFLNKPDRWSDAKGDNSDNESLFSIETVTLK